MDMSAQYTEMHDKVLSALVSGNVEPFPGVEDSFRRQLIFASCWKIPASIDQLLGDLFSVEDPCFRFIYSGVNYPLHATLKQAKAPNNVVWPDEIPRNRLMNCSQVSFDTLILDGANLILAASNVPDELVAMRADLDQELVKYGLEPLPLPILHITLARMVQVPGSVEGKQRAFASYQEALLPWRNKLAEQPVVLDLNTKIRMTSTYDLLKRPFRTD